MDKVHQWIDLANEFHKILILLCAQNVAAPQLVHEQRGREPRAVAEPCAQRLLPSFIRLSKNSTPGQFTFVFVCLQHYMQTKNE